MKMSLDQTWKNCMSMWRSMARKVRAGDTRHAFDLKQEWLNDHGFDLSSMTDACFFCQYAKDNTPKKRISTCSYCPACMVDPDFDCDRTDLSYSWDEVIGFYNKLVSLNRKRLKGKKN